jgi:hypothetical protein
MNKNVFIRIIVDLLVVVVVVHGWWFFAIPLGLFGAWIFPYYIEIILAGIFFDSIFGMSDGIGILQYQGTIFCILVFFMAFGLRKVVRLDQS